MPLSTAGNPAGPNIFGGTPFGGRSRLPVAIAEIGDFSLPRLQLKPATGTDMVLSFEQGATRPAQLRPRHRIGKDVAALQVERDHVLADPCQFPLFLAREYLLLPERLEYLRVALSTEGDQVRRKTEPLVADVDALAHVLRDDLVDFQHIEVAFAAVSATPAIPADDLLSQSALHARHLQGDLSVHPFSGMFKASPRLQGAQPDAA